MDFVGLRMDSYGVIKSDRPAEAELIELLRTQSAGISVSRAAAAAGISEGRWRQVAKGYQQVTKETRVPVVAPDDTLARMADAVGATPQQLREAGRGEAASILQSRLHHPVRGIEASGPFVDDEEDPLEVLESVVAQGWSTAQTLTDAVVASYPSEELQAAARAAVHFIDAYLIIRILSSGLAPQMEHWLSRIYRERELMWRQLSTGEPHFPWLTDIEIQAEDEEYALEVAAQPDASSETVQAQEVSADEPHAGSGFGRVESHLTGNSVGVEDADDAQDQGR